MAAPADYLSAKDLLSVAAGGVIHEDVLDEIFDNSDIPTPILDLIGEDGFSNPYASWLEDKLPEPDLTNNAVDGADSSSANNKATLANQKRVGNHAQISKKDVFVTDRADAVNTIGRSSEMGYQTARNLQALRRDIEGIITSNQASREDNGDDTPGLTAGMGAWIKTNSSSGAGGAAGGFNTGTKLVVAPTAGAARDLTWENIADQIENVYLLGGDATVLTSIPSITKRIARYLFATPYAALPRANVDGQSSSVDQTSQGYIDAFRTDFGTLMRIVPNRLQQSYKSIEDEPPNIDVANLYGIDPRYWKLGLLYGWKVDALGKKGLSYAKLLHVDWMSKSYLERANFVIRDIKLKPTITTGT